MIPNYWDPAKADESVQRCKDLGARCLMVPIVPRKDVDGEDIAYNNPKMDPFFAAVAASGIPLCFHIGENLPTALPGAAGTFVLTQMQGFRPIFGALVFGGVFDRYPDLQVVFVEGGICWVASALHDADMIYTHFPTAMNPKLEHPPSWYWHHHCYATFMTDPAGLELLHRIGADRVMWSSDYPHQESTWGYTRSAIDAVFAATTVENAQAILGKTALHGLRHGVTAPAAVEAGCPDADAPLPDGGQRRGSGPIDGPPAELLRARVEHPVVTASHDGTRNGGNDREGPVARGQHRREADLRSLFVIGQVDAGVARDVTGHAGRDERRRHHVVEAQREAHRVRQRRAHGAPPPAAGDESVGLERGEPGPPPPVLVGRGEGAPHRVG